MNKVLPGLVLLSIWALRGSSSNASLITELEEQSRSDGWLIAGVMNRDFMVFPFSGSPVIRRFFDYNLGASRVAPDGRAVLGYSYLDNPGIPARRLALISADGRVTALLNRDVINVIDLAVASDRIEVVFAGKDPSTDEVGIFLGRLGTNDTHLIVPLQSHSGDLPETTVAWVPDGSAVLFSRDSEVWTYDLGSRRTAIRFRAGTNPTCSPDGHWIAYRNSNGYAMIASLRGAETKQASRGLIYGRVHWSPDSSYYFVNEKVSGSSLQSCPFGYCFVVYRMSDGTRLQLHGTDRKDSSFGWLRGPGWPRD